MPFLLANWKLIAIGLLILALGAAGLLLKSAWAENGALETKLANADAVIKQHQKDAKANAAAVAQLAQKLTDTETKVITVTERIYAAPVTRACADTPAMRAANDGIRQLFNAGPPTVQAPGGRQPAPAVRRSGAGS